MALIDTEGVDNLAYALDNHVSASGSKSLFDGVSDVVTKGIPLTGLAVVNSFANTGIDLTNWITGSNFERYDPNVQLADSADLLGYYNDHKEGIETAGLVVGSLVPGTLAIKALKVAQAGKFGSNIAKATGIFAGPRDDIIKGALTEIEAGNASLYGQITADKYKAIALGFGDQFMQAAAYEVATAATMKASPILDKQGLGDIVSNVFFGGLVGGVIGGSIEGIWLRGTINKALLKQDVKEKPYELSTYLGKGGYIAGDRVVALLDSLDSIPAAVTGSEARKVAKTRDTGILASKKILAEITPVAGEVDNELSNGVLNVLLRMKEEGQLGKEEMYDYLAGLSRISRVNAAPTPTNPDIFYVNQFTRTADADFATLITTKPVGPEASSLGYKMRADATGVKISRFDEVISWEGQSTPRFTSKEEAFGAGNDIYIDSKLRVHVNEQSEALERVAKPGESRPLSRAEELSYRKTGQLPEGAEPLHGAPIVLNVLDGRIKSSAVAVVGDIAPAAELRLAKDARGKVVGLAIGKDKTSIQNLQSGFAFDTIDAIDANARYVWAHLRGVNPKDVVNYNDIPMLEEIWRSAKTPDKSDLKQLNDLGVRIRNADGELQELPVDSIQLLRSIQEQKDQVIKELLMKGDNISSAEVAIRANVPESYLESGLQGSKHEDFIIPVEQHMQLNHARLEYNVSNINQQDGMILRGMIDAQYRIQLVQATLRDTATDFFKERVGDFVITRTAADADILGTGAKGFSSSNSAYNTLGQETEIVGKNATALIQERRGLVSQRLSNEHQAIVADPVAAAELGIITNVLRKTGQRYVLPSAEEAQALGLPYGRMVLEKAVSRDANGVLTAFNADYIPPGFLSGARGTIGAVEKVAEAGKYTYYNLSEKTANYLRSHVSINDERLAAFNKFYAANGLMKELQPGSVYVPPIDTQKYKFVALVRTRRGAGMATDDVAAIVSDTAAGLEQKAAALREEYDVIFKSDIKNYHAAQGDYEYGLNFSQQTVDSLLTRKGVLSEVFPDTRAETVLKQYTDWHYKQETRLVRNHVELANAQLFAELRALGDRFTAAETSSTGYLPSAFGKTAPNPYNSYINTALAISPKEQYRLWAEANEKLEGYFDTAFRTAKQSFLAAKSGLLSYEEAVATTQKYGLGNPYGAATDAIKTYYDVANKLPPEKYLSRFVATANSVLSATAIRLDFFQGLINIVSTPVLLLAEAQSLIKANHPSLTTALPSGGNAPAHNIPAVSKLLYTAVGNWFGTRGEGLKTMYRELGVVRGKSSEYFQMVDELTLPISGLQSEKDLTARLGRAVEIGSKLTGSSFSEEFARFVAADVGRQIFEASGYAGRQLTDNISTFVNRVHGNYIASQRPVAFQGPIGQAIGLFQTYQFNLMQQLFRYVENREAKTVATLFGIQGTLFGLQGLPGFQAINNHIIGNAAGNTGHNDVYSVTPQFFGKEVGDYLLYGTLSNWMKTGLYSRGDINPRQITILPTNPLDYPAISGGIRFISSLLNSGSKVVNGGDISNSLLMGLEHNGLSRPLAGLAQMVQGYATTSKGSLVAATRSQWGDFAGSSDLYSVGTYSRLLGARPLDEAVAMDAMYRKTLYQAKDTARIGKLGEVVKSHLYAGGHVPEGEVENFAARYAKSGGRIENFGRKMIEWTRDANTGQANEIYRSLRSPVNQNMMKIMGGEQLRDFTNMPSTDVPPT